jgi:hypothetical protein
MNSEHFIKFVKYFGEFCYNRKYNPEAILSFGRQSDEFINSIKTSLANCKVFEISDETKKLLALTDPPNKNDEVKLPFPFIFLNVSFTKEELAELGVEIDAPEIEGIVFQEGVLIRGGEKGKEIGDVMMSNAYDKIMVEGIDKVAGTNLRITMASIENNGEFWFNTFNKNNNLLDTYKEFNCKIIENPTTDRKARDFVHRFVINFLNFLNDPEVEYIEHLRSEKNMQRRAREGKPIIPSSFSIQISGRLKKYIDEIVSKGHLKYGFSFWIRGHFRRLQSDRYKEKKTIFIAPYVKGEGILVNKHYVVKKANEQGINFATQGGNENDSI